MDIGEQEIARREADRAAQLPLLSVLTVPSDGIPSGTVARDVRRGWRLGEELLRPARVVVARSPEVAGPWP